MSIWIVVIMMCTPLNEPSLVGLINKIPIQHRAAACHLILNRIKNFTFNQCIQTIWMCRRRSASIKFTRAPHTAPFNLQKSDSVSVNGIVWCFDCTNFAVAAFFFCNDSMVNGVGPLHGTHLWSSLCLHCGTLIYVWTVLRLKTSFSNDLTAVTLLW